MIVGNLSTEDFSKIDNYCKDNFDDSRKHMVLTLIRYHEGDTNVRILDDKITLIYDNLLTRIETLEKMLAVQVHAEKKLKEAPKQRPTWKGFNQDDKNNN